MNSTRWISIFVTLSLIGWLCWFEKFIVESTFSAQTFGSARILVGWAIVVLVAITIAVLSLITIVLEWRFDTLVAKGKEECTKDMPNNALQTFLQAQRINELWMRNRELRVLILRELAVVYRKLNDQQAYMDVEHRIRAIESLPEFTSLEHLLVKERLQSTHEPIQITAYAVALVFSLLLFVAGGFFLPTPPGSSVLPDYFVRLIGLAATTFVLAEAIGGKAHGGTSPKPVRWKDKPLVFSLTAGICLCAGLCIMLRLDRVFVTTGYWQIPATTQCWAISGGTLILSFLTCYILGFVHERTSN